MSEPDRASTAELDYGRGRRRRGPDPRAVAGAVVGIACAVALLAAARAAWIGWPRWQARRAWCAESAAWFAAAASFAEPADRLKYSERPADAALPGAGPDAAYYDSAAMTATRYRDFGGDPRERVPDPRPDGTWGWQPFASNFVFLHARTTAGRGTTLLVAIAPPHFVAAVTAGTPSVVDFDCRQVTLVDGAAATVAQSYVRVDLGAPAAPGNLRVYAGQADPENAARFAIPFDADGRRGWIDGTLVDAPATTPQPAAWARSPLPPCRIELRLRAVATTSTRGG